MTNQYSTDKQNGNDQNDDNTPKTFESGRKRRNIKDFGIKKSHYYKNTYEYDNRYYYNTSNNNQYYKEDEHRPKKILTKKTEYDDPNKEEKNIGPQQVTISLQLNGATGLKDLFKV